MPLTLRTPLVLLALALAPGAALAAGPLANRLEDIRGSVDRLESQVGELGQDFETRRGLIGVIEARNRFEEAVYQYLIGEYEPAALTFFTLVDAQALGSKPLHQDAEWYLAECLFELGNHATAAEAYRVVVGEGPEHPFFADGVRRLLEVYGLLRDVDAFYDTYQRYIVTGRVQSTDFVKYTVAKSLWRQGESARAKAMFAEVAPDSDSFIRARYFLGAVLASEGAYEDALAEFQRVVSSEGASHPSDVDVQQLAWMAIGRLSYELGDYPRATLAYQKIPSDSTLFGEQLYELVWTYVKQERWEDALEHLDIFLLGFPTHPQAVNLKLTRGHILMKQQRREEALDSYDEVVSEYSPVHETLGLLKYNRTDPARYFRMLADPEIHPLPPGEDLPDFAVEILQDDDQIGRAVEIYRAMDAQQADLDWSAEQVELVGEVLRRADSDIGTFARGRATVGALRDENLQMQAALVSYEIDYLLARGSGADRGLVQALENRFSVLSLRSAAAEQETRVDQDRLRALGQQVAAVQRVASRVRQVAQDELARAQAVRSLADENPARLPADMLDQAKTDLESVRRDLERADQALERLTADSTRTSMLAMVSGGEGDDDARKRAALAADLRGLREELQRFRARVEASDGAATFARLDELWLRTEALDRRGADILRRLGDAERGELAVLRRRLDEESARVADAQDELGRIQADAGDIATDVALVGFTQLESEIGQTLLEADVGIIDVYWLEKTEASDEMERLGKERASNIQQLDERFRVVRQRLEGSADSRGAKGN